MRVTMDRAGRLVVPKPLREELRLERELVRTLAAAGRIGGAVYDALVALTAKTAGAVLVTADTRARSTNELVGVELRLLNQAQA